MTSQRKENRYGWVGVCPKCRNLFKTDAECISVVCGCGTKVKMYIGVIKDMGVSE